MSKERFFKGTFLLTSAGLISRIMGFFYRIFLSHTIGAEGIGLYQLVVPLQHLVLAMTTFGIQTSLSRLISSHTALVPFLLFFSPAWPHGAFLLFLIFLLYRF